MTRIYIAGPMTGLPELNYPAFHDRAARLRAQGHTVLNPAENPEPPCGTWLGYMRMAIAQLVTCDAIDLLPGWEQSRGANVEVLLGLGIGLEVNAVNPTDQRAVLPAKLLAAARAESLTWADRLAIGQAIARASDPRLTPALTYALRKLSNALGYKVGQLVEAFGDETVEAALVREAAERLEALAAQQGGAWQARALAHLDGLLDDAAAHIFPSDLAKCQTSECTVTVASVRMGSPAERSVPLFSREQVADALAAAQCKRGSVPGADVIWRNADGTPVLVPFEGKAPA